MIPVKEKIDHLNYGFTYFEGPVRPFERMHTHNEVELGTVCGGTVTAVFGGRVLHLADGDSILFWASQPHGPIEVSGQPYARNIVIPLPHVLNWNLPAEFQHKLLSGTVFSCARDASRLNANVLFEEWRELIAGDDAERKALALLELHAFARRMALQQDEPQPGQVISHNSGSRYFQQIAGYIAEHHREQITVADVIAQTRLHPKYAMRMFKKITGCTLLDYLTQQRIGTAKHLLLTTEMSTLEIAFACGFGSVSRFYSAFKTVEGCPPARFRRRHLK